MNCKGLFIIAVITTSLICCVGQAFAIDSSEIKSFSLDETNIYFTDGNNIYTYNDPVKGLYIVSNFNSYSFQVDSSNNITSITFSNHPYNQLGGNLVKLLHWFSSFILGCFLLGMVWWAVRPK